MDSKDFLDLAGNLIKDYHNEAAFRTSVSRSYYALHTYMSNFLSDENFELGKDERRHKKIYIYLHNCGIEEVEEAASDLDDLRNQRNRADYEMNINCQRRDAEFVFCKASEAYEVFSRYINSPELRAKLKNGILKYRRIISGQKRLNQ